MKLRERLKADKAALARLQGKDKIEFLWDYYKLPIISLACVLVIAVLVLLSGTGHRDVAMYAVLVNTDRLDEAPDPAILETLLEQGGMELRGKRIDVSVDLYLGQDYDQLNDGQTIQVLAALFGIRGLDFFAADEPVFRSYAEQDAFVDLSLLIEPALLEGHSGDLYYYENSEGRQILGGVILHAGSPLHRAGYYHGDIVVGAAASAQNLEAAVLFLKQLL